MTNLINTINKNENNCDNCHYLDKKTPVNYNDYLYKGKMINIIRNFRDKTSVLNREVDLFDPFMDSLRLLGNTFAEKIHGRSIVEFDGYDTGKYDCRCELADLAIFTYSLKKRIFRLTLNQVKLAKKYYDFENKPNYFFIQNRKQWLLLSKRSIFRPYKNRKTFDGNTLQNASLSSIGSFGIFYKAKEYIYEFKYFIANLLKPNPSLKGCKLYFKGEYRKTHFYNILHLKEIEGCESLHCFFCALQNGLIGSPINNLLNDNSFYESMLDILDSAKNSTDGLPSNLNNRINNNMRIINDVRKLIAELKDVTNEGVSNNSNFSNSRLKFSIRNLIIMNLDD